MTNLDTSMVTIIVNMTLMMKLWNLMIKSVLMRTILIMKMEVLFIPYQKKDRLATRKEL